MYAIGACSRGVTAANPSERVVPKYFTVEEANRTLPLVRRIVEDVVSAHLDFIDRLDERRSLDPTAERDAARRAELEADLRELAGTINGYVGELNDLGVLFKGFDPGLVDFHALLDGRPVFLCWKLGEERVKWWHEVEAGYPGRQRLPRPLGAVAGGPQEVGDGP